MELRKHEIAINPAVIVISECITVTSAMRKHARWAHSSIASILGEPEAPRTRETSVARIASPLITASDLGNGGAVKTSDESRQEIGLREVAMARKWSPGSKKARVTSDNPLMAAFSRLRSTLSSRQGTLYPHYLQLLIC